MTEFSDIVVFPAHVDSATALQIVAAVDPHADVSIGRLLYYPYFYFAASCSVKSVFVRRQIPAKCLVDGSRGIAATADGFEASKQTVPTEAILGTLVSPGEATRQARRYLGHSLGKKTRSIANFEVDLENRGIVYKGFWLVECGSHAFIVDSITGHLHALRQAA
jgi:hypothetical protein